MSEKSSDKNGGKRHRIDIKQIAGLANLPSPLRPREVAKEITAELKAGLASEKWRGDFRSCGQSLELGGA